MELKPLSNLLHPLSKQLLIVPYGIETNKIFNIIVCGLLLIVPYGIETR